MLLATAAADFHEYHAGQMESMGYDCPDGMSWDAANAMCVGSTNFSYSETSYMDGGSFSSGGGQMMMSGGGMSGGYTEYSSSSMSM